MVHIPTSFIRPESPPPPPQPRGVPPVMATPPEIDMMPDTPTERKAAIKKEPRRSMMKPGGGLIPKLSMKDFTVSPEQIIESLGLDIANGSAVYGNGNGPN